MKKTALAFLLAPLLIPSPAFPWGELGHFTLCEIAYRQLDPQVQSEVNKLLGNAVFAKECTWADKIRGARKETGPWHYINFEQEESYPETINQAGDVAQALIRSEDTLRSLKSDEAAKVESLKFLMHFAGDVHQPLHVGYGSDRGGNQKYVTWFSKTFHTYTFENFENEMVTQRSKINLHSVWDTHLLEKFTERSLDIKEGQQAYQAYADEIQKASSEEIKTWQKSTYLDWVSESRTYLEGAYEIGEGRLGETYFKKHYPVVNKRLKMGGYRLAGVLNRIFKNVPLSKAEREMREKIQKALEKPLAVAP